MKQPFEAIVAQHSVTVLRVCRALLGAHDADDAWSETFLAAMRAYPDLPDTANVEAWLVTMARRKAIDVHRWPEEPQRELSGRTHERSTTMNDTNIPALTAPIDSETLAMLHHRLEAAAQAQGLLDVAYATVDSPVGTLLLAATPKGLVRVAYAVEDHDRVLESLAVKVSPRILHSPKQLDDAARELDEYFDRKRKVFDLDLDLDLSLSHGFRGLVQQHLPEIGYGQTRSYKEMAALVGNPKAIRAVGTACATNPLPVVVPCHRVLRTDGSFGGYIGGLEAKTALLELEAAA